MSKLEFTSRNGSIILTVSADKSEAYLTLKSSEVFYSEEDISELIAKAGINTGLKEANEYLKRQGITKSIDTPFLIAKGILPTLPSIVYKLNEPLQLLSYQTLINKQIQNVKQFGRLNFVQKGALLGSVELEGKGAPGISVFGEEIEIDNPMPLLCGENVSFDDDRKLFVAEINGYLYIDERRRFAVTDTVNIENDLTLKGEERYHVEGSLSVGGNLSGAGLLKINGNLHLTGNLEGLELDVERSIEVGGSIKMCSIFAKESLKASKVIDSKVRVGKSLNIGEEAIKSLLISGKSVDCGIVTGCNVLAGESVETLSVFSDSEFTSSLSIALSPYLKEVYAKINSTLAVIDSEAGQNERTALLQRKEEIEGELTKAFTEIVYEDRWIKVKETVAKGIAIRILKEGLVLENDSEKVIFSLTKDGLLMEFEEAQ
ncbi:MAG: flagellar assembly protein A [Candidatus Cloacimonadia bacterium]